jgi:hypothetical protein
MGRSGRSQKPQPSAQRGKTHFAEMIESERAMFLGSEHIPVNHG